MNYFSFLLETLWKPSWALNLKQQPRLIYVYSGEIKKWSFFGLCSSYPLIRISQIMRVGEGLVQKTCNIHFPFPDCSNIREGTFKHSIAMVSVFLETGTIKLSCQRTRASLMSKKIII